jgi:hypothetical protein
MQRLLTALALALPLALTCQAARTAQVQAQAVPGLPAGAVVQASLAAPARAEPQAQPRRPAQAAAPAVTTTDKQDTERQPTTAMLLAALALMVAIALRRWGAGQA